LGDEPFSEFFFGWNLSAQVVIAAPLKIVNGSGAGRITSLTSRHYRGKLPS
jgi:hypothetical protein